MRSQATWWWVALACLAVGGFSAPAVAHCDPGTSGHVLGLPVSTCALNAPVEQVLEQAGALTGDRVSVVLVKDFRFHPEVVHVASGGSVVFVYADADWSQFHDPLSSGPCAAGSPDPTLQPQGCVPTAPGRCFDQAADMGSFLSQPGDVYPLTLRYDAASHRLEKSRGLLSGTPILGEPPLAEAFRVCPSNTGTAVAGGLLVPYHCGLHGAAGTAIRAMRGTLVVDA